MTDGTGDREDVGSVAEEAARLLGALNGWARDHASDTAEAAGPASGTGEGILHDLDEHIATGGRDCRYCPVCQLISGVRSTSPEVRQHLTTAATSLLHAATGLLDSYSQRGSAPGGTAPDRRDPVEKIDLTDGEGDTEREDQPWD